MESFLRLWETIENEKILRTENYIKDVMAMLTIQDAFDRVRKLSSLVQKLNKSVSTWINLSSDKESGEKIRQAWVHIPYLFGQLNKELTLARNAAHQVLSRKVNQVVGGDYFDFIYKKYAPKTKPAPDTDININMEIKDFNAIHFTLGNLVNQLRKIFPSGRNTMMGTVNYIAPEMANKGFDEIRDRNITSYINMACFSLSNYPELEHYGKNIEQVIEPLDDGMYYFIRLYDEVAPQMKKSNQPVFFTSKDLPEPAIEKTRIIRRPD